MVSMKIILAPALLACLPWLGAQFSPQEPAPSPAPTPAPAPAMNLGAFSVSLAVKDLAVSRDFYAKLGFTKLAGDEKQNYLILQNGTTVIGLFQGMFEDNILTFNPGWDHNGKNSDPFTDVRKLQATLAEKGIAPVKPIEPEALKGSGPASMVIADPDGNMILLDQHR